MSFEPVTTKTPTLVGHVQLVIDDGRHSDDTGTIVSGTPQDNLGTTATAIVLDQDDASMGKKREPDATQHLSPASQQKLLEVMDEVRATIGGILLP